MIGSQIFLFVGIVNGKFEIHAENTDTDKMDADTFELDDVAGLARFIKPFRKNTLATSSSIDYPEDDGAPEGFDARVVLEQALHLARG
jgi:hypothetical protein|tara:strand:+ start:1353 stop:1616 length:264 start_codon:yes stop_codon:yes gene_type:complete